MNKATLPISAKGLSYSRALKLGWTLLWREMKSGQLKVIALALILAVSVATIISVFSSRMDAGMLAKSSELLGADLRLRSSQKIPIAYQEKAEGMGFRTAMIAEFPSVVLSGEEMALAAVKVVSHAYPLKGKIFTSENMFTAGASQGVQRERGPPPGEVWVESRLLALLNADIGSILEVGKSSFKVSAVIQQESDRGGNFYSLSPRLMMNMADLESSALIQTGSRVTWRLLVAEPFAKIADSAANTQTEKIDIQHYKSWLEPRLSISQTIETLDDSNLALSASLDKASQYLSLAAILAILLAGIAIAMSARDYTQHHFDTAAMFRTFGATQAQLSYVFFSQLFTLAIITSAIGLVVGGLLQAQLSKLIAVLFVNDLPSADWSAWAIASVTAPVTLLGFAMPELFRLSKVSPLRILRRDIEPASLSAYMIYFVALTTILSLCIWFTRDLKLSLIIIVGGSFCLAVLTYLLRGFLQALNRVTPTSHWSLYPRFAWQRIMRNSETTSTQIMAFALIVMVMIIISVVRSDLLADWQRSLPKDAPNFFAMNIQAFEAEEYEQALMAEGFKNKPLFPMIPGRLTHINDEAVHDDPKRKEDPALQRDLALTWNKHLPEGNKILEGTWLNESSKMEVSIESRLAKRLNINLSDELRFDVAGTSFAVSVSSIRSVDWGTLTPNFYMILSEDALSGLPLNYLTSFHVKAGAEESLTKIIRLFPTITVLDMNMVFTQIQTLLSQVTLAVEYLLALVLLGGLLVLVAAIHTSLDERLLQSAMLRTLGASRTDLRINQWGEFALLGFIAALFALLGAELLCFALYTQLLDLDYQPQWSLWLIIPFVSSLTILALGALATRRVEKESPMTTLREL